MVDRGRLVQAFENLVLNAIKFTPPGGKITIAAEDKGDIVCFAVTDTGIGIDKKDHDRIFEKFYQVDSSPTRTATGAGLGLAIVKSIVEMHGGKIWVDSEPAKGSSFQFLIPRAKNPLASATSEINETTDPAMDGKIDKKRGK
jgi:signal transduction histidine kinase